MNEINWILLVGMLTRVELFAAVNPFCGKMVCEINYDETTVDIIMVINNDGIVFRTIVLRFNDTSVPSFRYF